MPPRPHVVVACCACALAVLVGCAVDEDEGAERRDADASVVDDAPADDDDGEGDGDGDSAPLAPRWPSPSLEPLPVAAPPAPRPPPEPVCPVDLEQYVTVTAGEAPVVVVATHAGGEHPEGCDDDSAVVRAVGTRTCTADLEACASGPCRASGVDRHSGALATDLVDALEACLGARPSFVRTEISRVHLDMNRDAFDPVGGGRCALDDGAALPLWQSFHDVVDALAHDAARVHGGHALVLDLHTHASLAAAPAPVVMLGSGVPFGTTLPHRRARDARFSSGDGDVFGDAGLRVRITAGVLALNPAARVFPPAADGADPSLFNGRYVVHHAAGVEVGHPAGDDADRVVVDALQLEVSDGLREQHLAVAHVVADALCATLLR
jgi:hypothetical protein